MVKLFQQNQVCLILVWYVGERTVMVENKAVPGIIERLWGMGFS